MRAYRTTAKVQTGNRVEIAAPDFSEGEEVEVILLSQNPESGGCNSVLEIIAGLEGHRLFSSPDAVDQHVRIERASWGD